MFYSIDLGGSTVDILLFSEEKYAVVHSLESHQVNKSDLKDIFHKSGLSWKKSEKIVLTGGHSRTFQKEFEGIPLRIISEIDAIGYGGLFLAKSQSGLVCSLGTGTCFVSARKGKYAHVGGTGVGGGTVLGLSRTMLRIHSFSEIHTFLDQTKNSVVDLLVEEIVKGGIGIVPGSATAANFAKASSQSTKKDIAYGIINMVGQTIASLATFAARMEKHQKIILGGKLTRLPQIVEIIKKTARIYRREIIVPRHAEYLSAIGAGEKEKYFSPKNS
jgi:type II pantothenate kinase